MTLLLCLWISLVSLFIAADAAPAGASGSLAAPTATIDSGVVVGRTTSIASATVTVNQYLGIPFAASPTRFAIATAPTPWTTPFNATKWGPACIQQFNYPEAARNALIAWLDTPRPPAGEDEDCLNLNVYVPGSPGKNKTVLAWIYGGNLQSGHNSKPIYDGSSIAAHQDIIVVVFNYRTNVFGFSNSPEIPLVGRNVGLWDQRLAINWIQKNIVAFGGDPGKLTLVGQDAGAASVDMLITTTPKNPPFRAGIMQSGQSSSYVNPTNSPASWLALAAALNCTKTHPTSNLTCLRNQTAATLKSTIEHLELHFRPVSDNVTLLRYPEAARLSKSIAAVPILTGTNANEASIFTADSDPHALLLSAFGGQWALVQQILSAYPGLSPAAQSAAILTDYLFQCPAAIVANDSYTAGFPTWRYYFNASFPNTQVIPGRDLGAFHGSEIPIVFGTYPPQNATEFEKRLSEFTQASWATFARNPNGGPGWAEAPQVADLGANNTLRTVLKSQQLDNKCGLYRKIYESLGTVVPGTGS